MDAPSTKPVSIVEVKPAYFSKINWTQIVSLVAMGLTMAFGYELTAEQQLHIVAAITILSNIGTMVLKTYFTSTITTHSAENIEQVPKALDQIVVSVPKPS